MCLLLPTSPCIKQSPYVCLSLSTSFCDRHTACVSVCYTITLYQAISICQPLPLSVTSKHRVSVIPSLCIKQLYFLPLSVPGKQLSASICISKQHTLQINPYFILYSTNITHWMATTNRYTFSL